MMKQFWIGAAAVMFSTSAFAADAFQPTGMQSSPFSGHIEGYLGGIHISFDGDSESLYSYGGAARGNYTFNQHWNVQGDLFIDTISEDGESLYSYGGAAHLYWRDPSSHAFGVFGSLERFGGEAFIEDVYTYRVGPEAQVYFGNVTLYGQAYYGQFRTDSGGMDDFDVWGARGVVRYFARDNLRFDGELGYHTIDFGPVDYDTLSAAVQANYRFSGTPLTVFGRYQYDNISVTGAPSDVHAHKYVVGLRATFGSGTLLEEDRYGATMDLARQNIPVPLF